MDRLEATLNQPGLGVVIAAIALLYGCAGTPETSGSPASSTSSTSSTLASIGAPTQGDGSPPVDVVAMDRVELVSCGQVKRDILALETNTEQSGPEIDRTRALLDLEGNTIELDRAGVDPAQPGEVDAFNARIDAHRARVDSFKLAVTRHNNTIDLIKDKVQRFNVECARRPFGDEDFNALPAELQAALRADMQSYTSPARSGGVRATRTSDGRVRIGK